MSKSYIDITDMGNGTFCIESSYDERFIKWLKQALRHGVEREFDPETKVWTVKGSKALYLVKRECVHFFEQAHYIYRERGERVYLNLVTGATSRQAGFWT